MPCVVIPMPNREGAAFACRGSRSKRCEPCNAVGRNRAAVALCDGPPRAGSRRKACDTPICGQHRTSIGPDRDLCPTCRDRAPSTSPRAEHVADRTFSLFDVVPPS